MCPRIILCHDTGPKAADLASQGLKSLNLWWKWLSPSFRLVIWGTLSHQCEVNTLVWINILPSEKEKDFSFVTRDLGKEKPPLPLRDSTTEQPPWPPPWLKNHSPQHHSSTEPSLLSASWLKASTLEDSWVTKGQAERCWHGDGSSYLLTCPPAFHEQMRQSPIHPSWYVSCTT